MPNSFYNVTGAPSARSFGASSVPRNEFALVEAGFDKISFALAGYAPLASPVFVGLPTAPTAPLGTNTNQLATMAAVLAAVNAAAGADLPLQAGNAGRVLTTNGTSASWTVPAFGIRWFDGAWALNAVNYIDDATSPSSAMPSLLTVGPGFGVIRLPLGGTLTLTTSDGWSIQCINGQNLAMPSSRFTAHGTWPLARAIPPFVDTPQASGGYPFPLNGFYPLSVSATQFLVGGFDGTGSAPVVVYAVNPTTGAVGLAQTVVTGGNGSPSLMATTGANSFVMVYLGPGGVDACAGTLSGLSITLGTPVAVGISSESDRGISLSPSLHVVAGGNGNLVAITASGTTVTVGAAVNAGNVSPRINALDSTRFLVCYSDGAGRLCFRIGTVSGTTITLGAVTQTADALNANEVLAFLAVDGGWLAASRNGGTTESRWYGVTVSGSTISVSAVAVASGAPVHSIGLVASAWRLHGRDQRPWASEAKGARIGDGVVFQPTLGGNSSRAYLVRLVGGAAVVGNNIDLGATGQFVTDWQTGSETFFVSTSATQRFTRLEVVSGSLTASWQQIIDPPRIILSPTVNTAVVNYGGTWYAWGSGLGPLNHSTPLCALGNDRALYLNGSPAVTRVYGPIA